MALKKIVNIIQKEPKRVQVVGGNPQDLIFRTKGPHKTSFQTGNLPGINPENSFVLRKGLKDKVLKISLNKKKKKRSLFLKV